MKDRLQKAYRYLQQEKIISTQDDLAKKMGFSRTSVTKALNDTDGYLTDSFVCKFYDIFSSIFNKSWLLTGEGSMLKGKDPNSIVNIGDSNINTVGSNIVNSKIATSKIEKKEDKIKELEQIIEEKENRIRDLEAMITDRDTIIDNFKYIVDILKQK